MRYVMDMNVNVSGYGYGRSTTTTKTTTSFEYDEKGQLVKKVVVVETTTAYPTTAPLPYNPGQVWCSGLSQNY